MKTTELKKAFEKHAEKIVVSDEKEISAGAKKSDFNIFSLKCLNNISFNLNINNFI